MAKPATQSSYQQDSLNESNLIKLTEFCCKHHELSEEQRELLVVSKYTAMLGLTVIATRCRYRLSTGQDMSETRAHSFRRMTGVLT